MKLHDGDLEVLTKVLQQSTVLQTLLLCKNNLTFTNGRFIKALAHNKTLLTLNVSSNQISNEAAKLFADALKVNQRIKILHLGQNHISGVGAQRLAITFARHSSLQEIYLGGNKIGDKAAQELCNAQASNCSIKVLDLNGNPISSHIKRNIKATTKFIAQRNTLIAQKDEEITSLKAHVNKLKEAIMSKDDELASLKMRNLNANASMKKASGNTVEDGSEMNEERTKKRLRALSPEDSSS